jgi:hypothetical protein
MKEEYDFSNAERGKFYHPEAKINTSINKQTNQDNSETIAFLNHRVNTIDEGLDDKEDDV